ncbi:MAG: signal peptidase II [Elusimicrobiota bacterium]|nr:signal peptidase II [Elusimicrobiota bacterium]
MMKKPFLAVFIVIALDQISKLGIDNFISYGASIPIIKPFHFFYITKVQNTGIAFSYFQNKNLLFTIFVLIFLLILIFWLYKNRSKISNLQKYAFCLIIGGGFGNLADRIFRGAVIDFLDFGINALRWPSFNIADSCVCIGAFLIMIELFKTRKRG